MAAGRRGLGMRPSALSSSRHHHLLPSTSYDVLDGYCRRSSCGWPSSITVYQLPHYGGWNGTSSKHEGRMIFGSDPQMYDLLWICYWNWITFTWEKKAIYAWGSVSMKMANECDCQEDCEEEVVGSWGNLGGYWHDHSHLSLQRIWYHPVWLISSRTFPILPIKYLVTFRLNQVQRGIDIFAVAHNQ